LSEDVANEFNRAFAEAINVAIEPKLRAIAGLVAGVETALVAVIGSLSSRGILPAREAKTAIDGALAVLTPENLASGQGHVLRQISNQLGRMAGDQAPTVQ
jgi:hypothetical protein